MKTATLVKDNIEGFRGHAALYKLSQPLEGYEYVICSTDYAMFGLETFIFGATKQGYVRDWGALEVYGTKRGTEDHRELLNDAGYELVIEPS